MARGPGKGVSGNPKGKPKGTPNRTTTEAKALMEQILYGEIDNIKDSLTRIRNDSDFRYIESINKLFSYVLPKRTDVTSQDEPIKQNLNVIVNSGETFDTLQSLRDGS